MDLEDKNEKIDENGNVIIKDGFHQVCVWEGISIPEVKGEMNKVELFEHIMFDKFKVRIKYLEEIKTYPDLDNPSTGGRNDIFFSIHVNDIIKFAIPRLEFNIRWIEDVLSVQNYKERIYPERVFYYCNWNFENLAKKEDLNETCTS